MVYTTCLSKTDLHFIKTCFGCNVIKVIIELINCDEQAIITVVVPVGAGVNTGTNLIQGKCEQGFKIV